MKKPIRRPQPVASVVIPVYNKCELTSACLDSIAKVGAKVPFEVIVVDDASSDATPQLLAQRGGQVHGLRNDTNRGFAGACNRGAAAAKGKFILFLNNDTLMLPGWLDGLAEELQTHPEVVIAGSKLVYADRLVQHAGVWFERNTRNPTHPNRLARADDPLVNRRRELQAVTGASFLVRANWFRDCGCFSEQYQTGYEDLDLCLTVRKRGGAVVYQPKSSLIHLESQTPGRMRHENENRRLFFARWSDQMLTDEDANAFSDGMRLVRHQDAHGRVVRAVRFKSHEEQDRWGLVAECQLAAAAGKHESVLRCLSNPDAWPEQADIRIWAGAQCQRLGLRRAARTHLLAAATLAPTPELRAHLALSDPSSPLPGAPSCVEWETELVRGITRTRAGDPQGACPDLEASLTHGAPPSWALHAIGTSAEMAGDAATAAAARSALLRMHHTDPAAARKLSP